MEVVREPEVGAGNMDTRLRREGFGMDNGLSRSHQQVAKEVCICPSVKVTTSNCGTRPEGSF